MNKVFKFLLFLLYATVIFFLPNNYIILYAFAINLIASFITKIKVKDVLNNILHFMPFILLTVIINYLLGYHIEAIWIGIKLILVCNITFIYSKTTTIARFC